MMSGLTVAVAARASAPFCRRVQQHGWRARPSATRPRHVTTTAIVQRLTSTSSNGSSSSGRGSGSSGGWGSIPLAPGASILLAAALLCSPSAQQTAEAGWWPFNRQPTSPLEDTVPRKAKRQRAKAELEMQEYLAKMRVPIQELIAGLRKGEVSRDDFDKRMASFNNEVELATHRIIYGAADPPDARRRFETEHGNCRYTPAAIQAVTALSPLIEIGAGRGHWQRALSKAGATVVAFDKWATNPGGSASVGMTAGVPQVGRVLPGDEHAIRLHRDKTLLLVYPPPGDTAVRCLREYRGDGLAYVGEGRGGVNANDAFFDGLNAEWEVTNVVELDPFPQCFERLFLLRRRREVVDAPPPQEAAQ